MVRLPKWRADEPTPEIDARWQRQIEGDEGMAVTYGPNFARYLRGNKGRLRPLPRLAGGARVYYRQYQEPAGFTMIADQSAATGTSEALLWPFNFTAIPAQALVPGQQVQIHAYGAATTPGASATTMTINPRWGTTTGGVTLGISGTSATVIASQTAVPWYLEFMATVRTVSDSATSSTVKSGGFICGITMGASATVPAILVMGGAAATVDTVSAEGIVFGVTLSGSASWTMTTQGVAIEVLN